ncbi:MULTISPECIES: DUF368 domain-containing protein [Psychrobacter]|uniref:Membrane protein n=1 Tax=Psychrobacter alimentarius TaxID=261164 RepID=A0ABN4N5C3_9GAMM|nr:MULTISPECIES: DUF368 domain-containing protein [Psychrobacter]AMT97967.1 membrane protein [Psychrobacter alimentarius]QCB29758.1 DUF368 domain-containing protein [Psychrobacter sp. PAMC27889]
MTAPQSPRPNESSTPQLPDENTRLITDSPKQLLGIYIRGMAMGAADIVPGVSGGTIALIAGIYERLINALSSIGPNLWQIFRQQGGIKGLFAVWRAVDATFLLFLVLGIATSFATLAGMIKYLLDYQPLLIWSFFFGLVVATVLILLTEIKRWNIGRVVLFFVGLIAAVVISSLPLLTATPSLPYLFFAGAIAICAMILPGISGSFILLLLGAYDTALEAVHTLNFTIIFTVIAGMATGLLLFTRALKWLLSRYYQATLTLLTGFIAGSLVKVWPWKVDALGTLNSTAVTNVMPWQYPTGAQWLTTLGLMLLGAVLVSLLSWWGHRSNRV